jgi:hypothetical protein
MYQIRSFHTLEAADSQHPLGFGDGEPARRSILKNRRQISDTAGWAN